MGGGASQSVRVIKIMIVGLDNSGKTTFLKQVKHGYGTGNSSSLPPQIRETIPTVGYSLEKFRKGQLDFEVYDMSGQSRYREMWNNYCKSIEGIIFVVDSSDSLRVSVAANELDILLEVEQVSKRPIPILFIANKADLQSSIDQDVLRQMMNLEALTNSRKWQVFETNSLKGTNIDTAFSWLSDTILQVFPKKQQSH